MKKIALFFSSLLLLVCLAVTVFAAQPTEVTLGDVRVQLLSDTLVRIEVKGPKGFEDRPSFTVVGRDCWEPVAYTAVSENGYTVLSTACYTVYIPEGKSDLAGCYVTDAEGKTLWAYAASTSANTYLPSPSEAPDSWFFTDAPRVIPSEEGYALTEPYADYNGWDMENDATDLFVFLPQGNYKTLTADFVKLTGRSELITLPLLGYWDSRYYAYTAETALQQIKDYRDRGYSIDVLVIDTDWRKVGETGGVGYEVNEELFPDMAAFLQEAHDLGVNVVFNDHPEPVDGTDNLLDKEEIAYRSEKLKLILSLGLDYWWYDRNWSVSLKPVHKDLSIYTTGMYAFDFVTEEYYNSIADIDEYARRALLMGNVDGIKNGVLSYAPELASHRYTLQWTGDVGVWEEDIADEIFNAVYGGAKLGLPYVSADIGGHMGGKLPDDLYVRWVQFGALSPIMRVHCGKNLTRMPWCFGETAESVAHTYVDMRYRLLPVYYALAHENYETGLPMVRRLDIDYPQYAESAANDQYLLGESILVAPLAEGFVSSEDYTLSLTAEYFPNADLSGEPTATETLTALPFDYGTGAHPLLGLSNSFSARYTGTVEIGGEDLCFRFFADDGIRVYIDGVLVADGWDVYDVYFTTEPLAAGSTHAIVIEYFEGINNAHLQMWAYPEVKTTRTVFIPDGEWMDVWTGETIAGPQTVTVTHGLITSPIFVRMGSILPLANNGANTSETDWSHLTLDLYPSVTNGADFTLYEDDTATVAYKDGHFRTTDLSLSGEGNTVTLSVGAAVGVFAGERAFDTRSWTVRMHARNDFGALTAMTLDGAPVAFTTVAKDGSVDPLSITGGARDNTVYEYTFTAPVTKASTLAFTFASTEADGVNTAYDSTAATVETAVEKLVKADAEENLSAIGNLDWAYFGALGHGTEIRKDVRHHRIGALTTVGSNSGFSDSFPLRWQDGDLRKVGTSRKGITAAAGFTLPLAVGPDKTQYTLYLGGWKSLATLTVRDRAGNVETFTVGDMTTNHYYKVTVDCTAPVESEIYVEFSLLSGSNITVTGVAASDGDRAELPEVDFEAGMHPVSFVTPYTDAVDLSALGTLDWEFYGKLKSGDTVNTYRKAGVADRIETIYSSINYHYDNKAPVLWSDGADVVAAETRSGINTKDKFTVKLDTAGADSATVLVGAWKGTNTLNVYDAYGLPLDDKKVVVQNDTASQMALVTLDLRDYTLDTATLEFAFTGNGNISIAAVALAGVSEDLNNDGETNLADVLLLLRAFLDRTDGAYDINRDGVFSLLDILTLLRKIVE